MRIKLVSVESGISAIGFRRIAAIAKASSVHEVEICFVPTENRYSAFAFMFPNCNSVLNEKDIIKIGRYLSDADVVAFSSMSYSKGVVAAIIKVIRVFNSQCRIIWGGAHPTLYPEEALLYADEICQGEGDKWISDRLGIFMPYPKLCHSEQGFDCQIYDFRRKRFRKMRHMDYAVFNGTLFRTLWTTGCPYSCAYCANDALIKLDKNYKTLQYNPVDWIIEEIELALFHYPFITTIAFDDDNFVSLPLGIIIQFGEMWEKRIRKPFVIYGMHPNTVTKTKVEYLIAVGMNRCRMGIQSGSAGTLKFYNRATTPARIEESANILIDASRKFNIVPPAFDIITDNPVEPGCNRIDTLELLYRLHRPYTLTIFSLRSFPGTKLHEKGLDLPDTHYLKTQPTMNNIMLYLLATCKPPRIIFDIMLEHLDEQWQLLFTLVKFTYHIKRGRDHIRHGDFSRIGGRWGYWIWALRKKLGR
jgi:anaerobic magnesium-protoporphyrin IX monomethyl ester cyclase